MLKVVENIGGGVLLGKFFFFIFTVFRATLHPS